MRTITLTAILILCSAGVLTACGGDGDHDRPPPEITTRILSDPGYDGDIQQTSSTTFNVQGITPDVQSLFAGIDPSTLTEYRAFLDFDLTGSGGVPGNADIDSAFLNIYINSFQPSLASLPILIELVSFQPPALLAGDFDRSLQPPLAYLRVSPAFNQSDVGTNVSIDVTPLMVQAQRLGLVDFQVRIMEDLGPATPGLIEINDSTGGDRSLHAPELIVTYF
jgi:hypothetical protein